MTNKNTQEVLSPAPRPLPMQRVNTRITQGQHRFIKEEAKRKDKTEGEIFREIVSEYITNHK